MGEKKKNNIKYSNKRSAYKRYGIFHSEYQNSHKIDMCTLFVDYKLFNRGY